MRWEKASTPKSVQGTNDFGKSGYGGPCPPSGTHRYYFKIFALDRELDLPFGAKRGQVDAAIKGHVVAQGELKARYSQKNNVVATALCRRATASNSRLEECR